MRDKVEEFKAVAKEYIGVFTWFLLNVAAIVLIVFVGAYATKIFLLCPLSLLAGMFCLTFPNDIEKGDEDD